MKTFGKLLVILIISKLLGLYFVLLFIGIPCIIGLILKRILDRCQAKRQPCEETKEEDIYLWK